MRHFIPNQIRIAAYIVIISGFVSAVELLIKAYFPALDRSLGVFIPLIVVNCIILARAEEFASKNSPLPSVIDGLSMGLGFTFALIVLAAIREIIGAGTIAGYPLLGSHYKPALLFIMPPGAFITLGCLIALVQKFKSLQGKKKNDIVFNIDDKDDKEDRVKEQTKERSDANAKAVLQNTADTGSAAADRDAALRKAAMEDKIKAIRGVLLQVKNDLKNKANANTGKSDDKDKNENSGDVK
jgi:electron transport complex protein RnfE